MHNWLTPVITAHIGSLVFVVVLHCCFSNTNTSVIMCAVPKSATCAGLAPMVGTCQSSDHAGPGLQHKLAFCAELHVCGLRHLHRTSF